MFSVMFSIMQSYKSLHMILMRNKICYLTQVEIGIGSFKMIDDHKNDTSINSGIHFFKNLIR